MLNFTRFGEASETFFGVVNARALSMSSDTPEKLPRRTVKAKAARTGKRWPLDHAAIERVCHVIKGWPAAPITWDAIIEEIKRTERGGGWSRQALSGNTRIMAAYQAKKVALAKGVPRTPPAKDMAAEVAAQQVETLKARIADLERLLVRYERRFLTMLHNGSIRGLTQQELEEPMHDVDRSVI